MSSVAGMEFKKCGCLPEQIMAAFSWKAHATGRRKGVERDGFLSGEVPSFSVFIPD